ATSFNYRRQNNFYNGVKIEQFSLDGNLVLGFKGDKSEQKRFLSLLEGDYDIVTIFAAQYWASDLALVNLAKIKAKIIFVPTGFSRLQDPLYFKKYFSLMPDWLNRIDLNVFLSTENQDYLFAQSQGIKNFVIIPNGADEREFLNSSQINIREKYKISESELLVLQVGTHTGEKGHKSALEIFAGAKFKQPATFLLVGDDFNGGCWNACEKRAQEINLQSGKRVILAKQERVETVASFLAADIFLFPSNLECSPLALYESLAAKLPFLSSPAGNASEIIKASGGGLLLPAKRKLFIRQSFLQFVKLLIKKILSLNFKPFNNHARFYEVDIRASIKILEELAANTEKRREMGERGFTYWQNGHTWSQIVQQYENIYQKLCQK
nr:glycosyltransferase family 4 protein [Planctomycetota bacterium]